jgi:hypothetical protein
VAVARRSLEVQTLASSRLASLRKTRSPPKQRSVLRGVLMGAVVTGFVFSGNYVFSALLATCCVLGQLEYYRAVISVGVYPARSLSVAVSIGAFAVALGGPGAHAAVMPLASVGMML